MHEELTCAGAFLQRMIEAIWPSFIHFPNHLPENAGITSAGILCFMLYWIIQTSLAVMPIHKLRVLFWVKAVIVPPTFLALFLWAVIVTKGGGPYVTGHAHMTSTYMFVSLGYKPCTELSYFFNQYSLQLIEVPPSWLLITVNMAKGIEGGCVSFFFKKKN